MSASATAVPSQNLDKAPAPPAVDQCPVCSAESATAKVYVSSRSDVSNRMVWSCVCAHEWERKPSDTVGLYPGTSAEPLSMSA